MPRRTYERDGQTIESVTTWTSLSPITAGWRANAAKARRRQRRWQKRLTNEILHSDYLGQLAEED